MIEDKYQKCGKLARDTTAVVDIDAVENWNFFDRRSDIYLNNFGVPPCPVELSGDSVTDITLICCRKDRTFSPQGVKDQALDA